MEYPMYAKTGLTGRKSVTIKNPDQISDAYFVEISGKACTVRRDGEEGTIIGIIKFDDWPAVLHLYFENSDMEELRKAGYQSTTNEVNLPVAPELSPVKWKGVRAFGSGGLKMMDVKGKDVAEFKKSRFGKRFGTLRIHDGQLSREMVDQIVVSFIAVSEKQRRQTKNGQGSALCGGCATSGLGV